MVDGPLLYQAQPNIHNHGQHHQQHHHQQQPHPQQQQQLLSGIQIIEPNDIICGRGGLPLKHPGNMAYRQLVGLNKELYATCLKTEKVRISKSIVAAIRESRGRFLEREDGKISTTMEDRDEVTGELVKWRDIGDKRAIEKTSQALREGQPKLLKKLEERQKLQQQKNGEGQIQGQGGEQNGGVDAAGAPPSSSQVQNGRDVGGSTSTIKTDVALLQWAEEQRTQNYSSGSSIKSEQKVSKIKANDVFSKFDTAAQNEALRKFSSSNVFDNPARADSRHDSWGSVDPAPLPDLISKSDHTPLPHTTNNDVHKFSNDEQEQLMTCLSISGGEPAEKMTSAQLETKRSSVKFMRLPSHMSELSIFSHDVHSLDSALDAAEREFEFEMLGEYDLDESHMSLWSFDQTGAAMGGGHMNNNNNVGNSDNLNNNNMTTNGPSPNNNHHQPMPRRSILRKSNKWTMQAAAAAAAMHNPAPLNHHCPDPGMIFTSTLDTTPGGINSGTDISGLVTGERRKSVVAFEMDVSRRRSSRMSMCSQLGDFQAMFKRDLGSMVSIQSAGFRELMEDVMNDDDSDEEVGEKHGNNAAMNGVAARQTV